MTIRNRETQEKINALKFEAIFISNPTHQTKNCNDFKKTHFKWLCKITNGSHVVEVDYWMGISHCKLNSKAIPRGFCNGYRMKHDEFEKLKKGTLTDVGFASFLENASPTPPELDSILNSLTKEADAINYEFEDWVEEFGYSPDSIEALKIWNECCGSYRKLKALNLDLEEMQKFYQDY